MADTGPLPERRQTGEIEAIASNAGRVKTIVGATVLVGGAVFACVAWFQNVQTKSEAVRQHATIEEHSIARDKEQGEQIQDIGHKVDTVGRNVNVIKCLMTARKKDRDKCGLE